MGTAHFVLLSLFYNGQDKEKKMLRHEREGTLPPGWSLTGLPAGLLAEFQRLAALVISTRFMPIVFLHVARSRRKQLTQARNPPNGHNHKVIGDVLRESLLLGMWPDISDLVPVVKMESFRPGETIFHKNEPSSSGIYFLFSGLANMGYATKNRKGTRSENMRTIKAPLALGDFAFLNEEPRLASIIAISDCDVMCVPRDKVLAAIQQLPAATAQLILTIAHDKRRANLPQCFPMSRQRVRCSPLFATLEDSVVDLVLSRLTPFVVPKGKSVAEKGTHAKQLFFIRRGVVGFRAGDGRKVILRTGATIGDREVIFHERFHHSYIALSNVDLYVLQYSELKQVMGTDNTIEPKVEAAALALRESDVVGAISTGFSVTECVEKIPIFSMFFTDAAKKDLEVIVQPVVFSSKQLIISTAEFCDRLLLLVRGTAFIRSTGLSRSSKPVAVTPGEWIGYSCCVQHRWAHSIVAAEPVDFLQIHRADYVQVLRRHRIYPSILGASMQLLQPLCPFPGHSPQLSKIVLSVPDPNTFPNLRMPNMHPTWNEERFLVSSPWKPSPHADRTKYLTERNKEIIVERIEKSGIRVSQGGETQSVPTPPMPKKVVKGTKPEYMAEENAVEVDAVGNLVSCQSMQEGGNETSTEVKHIPEKDSPKEVSIATSEEMREKCDSIVAHHEQSLYKIDSAMQNEWEEVKREDNNSDNDVNPAAETVSTATDVPLTKATTMRMEYIKQRLRWWNRDKSQIEVFRSPLKWNARPPSAKDSTKNTFHWSHRRASRNCSDDHGSLIGKMVEKLPQSPWRSYRHVNSKD